MARLLGLSDEQRLAIEQETGIKTEGVRLLMEASMQQAEQLAQQVIDKSIREVQEVVGPHGAVTRLQAGGVKISPGIGVGVYEDGVLKTTIEPDGDFLVGSNIEEPATMSLAVFVNEQTYNNELMGAGDLLIGDNTDGVSNVKYDASEGQLQFRLGTTVNVYMDTDGTLKAGGGAVVMDEDGITFNAETDTSEKPFKFVDSNGVVRGYLYFYDSSGVSTNFYLIAGDSLQDFISSILVSSLATIDNATAATVRATSGGLTARDCMLYMYNLPNVGNESANMELRVGHKTGGTYDKLFQFIVTVPDSGQASARMNESGNDIDFVVEGGTDQNLVFVDASTDRVGIGTATPSEKLDVAGNIKASGTITSGAGTGATPLDGWIAKSETWTRTGNHTFTLSGDFSADPDYQPGIKIKYNDGAVDYGTIASNSHAGGTTTINLIPNSDYLMAAATITGKYISKIEKPDRFPSEFSFSPSWTNLTVGNGTLTAKITEQHGNIKGHVEFVLGSTSSIGGSVSFTAPAAPSGYGFFTREPVGLVMLRDVSPAAAYIGQVVIVNSTDLGIRVLDVSATYPTQIVISASVPMTWATGDQLAFSFDYAW